MKKPEAIFTIISLVGIIVPLLVIFKIIDTKIGFPLIFLSLGAQQLVRGIYIVEKEKSVSRKISIVLGIFMLIFALAIVIPSEYGLF